MLASFRPALIGILREQRLPRRLHCYHKHVLVESFRTKTKNLTFEQRGAAPLILGFALGVGDPGAALTHGHFFIDRCIANSLVLHLGVHLGAQQHHDGGHPHPCHEANDGAERPVGLVVTPEIRRIPGEQKRSSDPRDGGPGTPPADPAPSRLAATGP
jgi:hypothetical protein